MLVSSSGRNQEGRTDVSGSILYESADKHMTNRSGDSTAVDYLICTCTSSWTRQYIKRFLVLLKEDGSVCLGHNIGWIHRGRYTICRDLDGCYGIIQETLPHSDVFPIGVIPFIS